MVIISNSWTGCSKLLLVVKSGERVELMKQEKMVELRKKAKPENMVELGKKKIVGVYLAAGSSRRMGTAKQSLELAVGVSLGGIALLKALACAELEQVIVVVQEGDTLAWLPEEARGQLASGRCRTVVCRDAGLGMAHSLRTGIQVAEELAADGAMVMLADQPFIEEAMLDELIDAYKADADYDYVASGDQGIPKPPVILGSRMWSAIASLEGDAGARALFHLPAFRGQIVEAAALTFMDIDTPQQYEEAKTIYKS
ncbi:NTP transferase domain-containing protein [Paenibacillus sp. LMG 31461]|uniref:NTP transferase domain-containing protein n=2 Tax=Paenibacillus plantarum TaxID=2654975 RepID=A0ABX1XLK0_9BACL|nr:NTP transferase domain-containing protein [Paenibacillus plantarum]